MRAGGPTTATPEANEADGGKLYPGELAWTNNALSDAQQLDFKTSWTGVVSSRIREESRTPIIQLRGVWAVFTIFLWSKWRGDCYCNGRAETVDKDAEYWPEDEVFAYKEYGVSDEDDSKHWSESDEDQEDTVAEDVFMTFKEPREILDTPLSEFQVEYGVSY